MKLSIWLMEVKLIGVAKSPGVRLTHGGTAENTVIPEAISVRESLSCRFFGLGKGALRLEILVDRMSSAAGAWTLGPGDRETGQRRFAQSLKGFREALKPATVKAEVAVAGVA